MPLNITIDHATTAHSSERSSSIIDEEEDSSGTGVQISPSSAQEYSDEENEGWVLYPDDIGPSESASRPRTSNQHRPVVEAPHPETARRQSSQRHPTHERVHRHPLPRVHRPPPPTSPESVDSNEEWPGYARGPPQHHGRTYAHWGHVTGNPPQNFPPSYSSGQSYSPFPTNSIIPPGQQLVPFANPAAPYGFSPYQTVSSGGAPGYFPSGPHMPNPLPPHGSPPYNGQEMMHHPPGAGYFPYAPQPYSIPPAMAPSPMYHPYAGIYSPPLVSTPPPPPPPPDTSKDDEKFARLEKLLMDQKAEQEAKEAAAKKAAEDAAAKAEAAKKIADDIAAAAAAAAAAATTEAEKKAAEEAAKNKAAADAAAEAAAKELAAKEAAAKEAAEVAAVEAAAATAAAVEAAKPKPAPPKEKKKPIKFKDAVGRKFSFPFDLCSTWSGMEDLIRQAFLHVDIIGPHVAEGHYDLVGPNGEIILPQVWETVLEPDWTVTMHMWPIPEPPKPEDPPPDAAAPEIVVVEPKKGGGSSAHPPPPPPPPPPAPPSGNAVVVSDGKRKGPAKLSPFVAWTAGRTNNKSKALKAQKNPEEAIQHDIVCRVM